MEMFFSGEYSEMCVMEVGDTSSNVLDCASTMTYMADEPAIDNPESTPN